MAKLVISFEGNSQGEFSLDKERTTIGRRPSNDIHIDNLAVSGDHAVIITISGDSFLEDLNSTNGTLVNKKPVKKHVLQHADVIEFGKYQLRYENLAQQKTSAQQQDFENTAVMPPTKVNAPLPKPQKATEKVEIKQAEIKQVADITPANQASQSQAQPNQTPPTQALPKPMPQATPQVAPLVQAEPNVQKVGRLQILTGSNSGHEVLLNKALTTFGEPGVQVVVINKRPHGYFVSHVEGEKRLLINGQKAGPQAYQLVDHDVIDLVGMKMEFYLA